MSAIRLARGATGRDLVVKFEGCYHGHSDSLLAKGAGSGLATLGIPVVARASPKAARRTRSPPRSTISRPCGPIFAERGGEMAVVAVEPVAANMGVVPPAPGFLEGLRELCTEHGALLLFDEVITGFRIAYGGAQSVLRRDARPHRARQGDGRRVPVRGVRRARDAHGAAGARRTRLPGGHAQREPAWRWRPGSPRSTWPAPPIPYPGLEATADVLTDGIAAAFAAIRAPRDDQPRRLDVQRVLRRWAGPELLGCERRPITSDMPGSSTTCWMPACTCRRRATSCGPSARRTAPRRRRGSSGPCRRSGVRPCGLGLPRSLQRSPRRPPRVPPLRADRPSPRRRRGRRCRSRAPGRRASAPPGSEPWHGDLRA